MSPLVPLDAGTADAGDGGDTGDGGAACDGGAALAACAANYAQCTAFTDLTAGSAVVTYGGLVGSAYSPPCIRIRAGQTVSFQGDFQLHILTQACGPGSVILASPTAATASYTFCAPGRYGYYCQNHGSPDGTGMAGAIDVVP